MQHSIIHAEKVMKSKMRKPKSVALRSLSKEDIRTGEYDTRESEMKKFIGE